MTRAERHGWRIAYRDATVRQAWIAVLAVVIICAVQLFVSKALGHTAESGWAYPIECCSGTDCAEIADSRVTTSPAGYVIDGKFVVPQSQVRQSPDGKYHACFPNPERLQCFFAPPAGS